MNDIVTKPLLLLIFGLGIYICVFKLKDWRNK